jgi:hypothetical protein
MNDFIKWLNQNSGAIQAVSVVILLFVTWWYAYITKKMAKTMQTDFLLRTRPYLIIEAGIDRRFGGIDSNKTIQLVAKLKNVGLVPLVYSNQGLEIKTVSINPQINEFVLFPQQTTSLYSNVVFIADLSDHGQNEKGKIKIQFWSHSIPNKKYFIERQFTLVGLNETFIDRDVFEETT